MEDSTFLDRIKAKVERLTGKEISLILDEGDPNKLAIELGVPIPRVILGSAVLEYPGFARMCTEYAIASICLEREIGALEFHLLLARN